MQRFLLTWFVLPALIMGCATLVLCQSQVSREQFSFDTPNKRDKGEPTRVIFNHRVHADDYSNRCSACHTTLKPHESLDNYSTSTIHAVCRSCHNRSKLPKNWSCRFCHSRSKETAGVATPTIKEPSL